MADTNGTGRLDRIETLLEKTGQRLNELGEKFHLMVDHHEAEFKHLMTWQVLMQEKMEKAEAAFQKAEAARQKDREDAERERQRLNELNAITDKRIAELVGAIVRLIPPAA